jgi:hypothetical protein
MTLHLELAELIEQEFCDQLAQALERKQDALIVRLANGITLTVRYAAADAYSLRWARDGIEAGIDTAPLHRRLATFPNHLHDAEGRIAADPLTDPAREAADNLRRVITALLADPTLGTGANR